jgi:hypothetical protein
LRGAQVTLLEYLGQVDAIVIRRDALEKTIAELIPARRGSRPSGRSRCLRGIDTLSAVGLWAAVGDFQRFAKAGQLMRGKRRTIVAAAVARELAGFCWALADAD